MNKTEIVKGVFTGVAVGTGIAGLWFGNHNVLVFSLAMAFLAGAWEK